MNFNDGVRQQFAVADFFVESYLTDLTPAEMLKRPAPGANHVAWQLGHLISAETRLVEAAKPGGDPIAGGFCRAAPKDTAASDNPKDFLSKEEYLKLAKNVREGTCEVLDSISEAELDKPPGGRVPPFVKAAGECLVVAAGHWVLHAGQWVVLRRELGRERKF